MLDSQGGFVTVATIVTRGRCPSALALFLLAADTLLLAGCGPIQYVGQVSGRSSTALLQADLVEADRLAPYEFTKARAYDLKAREEAAESSFELAIGYGRRAEEFARRAQVIARERAERRARAAERAEPLPARAPP